MNYQVHITKTAEHDIAKAADYIEFVLKNPQAADHLLDVATEKIGELTQMPEKLQLWMILFWLGGESDLLW